MNKKRIIFILVIAAVVILIIWNWDKIKTMFAASNDVAEREDACLSNATCRKCYNAYVGAGYTPNEARGICLAGGNTAT